MRRGPNKLRYHANNTDEMIRNVITKMMSAGPGRDRQTANGKTDPRVIEIAIVKNTGHQFTTIVGIGVGVEAEAEDTVVVPLALALANAIATVGVVAVVVAVAAQAAAEVGREVGIEVVTTAGHAADHGRNAVTHARDGVVEAISGVRVVKSCSMAYLWI